MSEERDGRNTRLTEDVAVWRAESEAPRPAPKLVGELRVDVAIVGGGFTGVSTAWHLSRRHPDLGIALLEADVLGGGASGRSGGQVLNGLADWDEGDPEVLRRVYAATRSGIDLAEELARTAPTGTFSRGGCVAVLTHPERADLAAQGVEALRRAGIPAEFVSGPDVPVRGASGAVIDPFAGRLNGFALLQALRPVLRDAGVQVYEHTTVRRVSGSAEISLETPEGRVRAGALVLATNAATPALGFFRHGLLPVTSHVVASAPLDDAAWRGLGWGDWDGFYDDLDRLCFASRTAGGRLVMGGGSNAAYGYGWRGRPVAPTALAERAIRASLARYFPGADALPIAHRWAGTLAVTLDRVCTMGVGGPARNVYHALGYSGHGAALALLAGRVIADLHEGNHEAWRSLPFYQRKLLPLPPEPLRWLGYQAWTRLTGKSPRKRR